MTDQLSLFPYDSRFSDQTAFDKDEHNQHLEGIRSTLRAKWLNDLRTKQAAERAASLFNDRRDK